MVRSFIFTLGFYIGTAVILLVGSPLLFGPRSWAMAGLAFHGHFVLYWMRLIIGTKIEVRGRENLPPNPVLLASKHQSAWETFAYPAILKDPALVLKEELLSIPIYGQFCKKFEMIPINRERASIALKEMIREALIRKYQKREIIIFPEGTRKNPGDPPDYKPGVIKLYEGLDLPCVPVALNSGVFWPRGDKRRFNGTIIIEFLPPIPPGVERKQFRHQLEHSIEEKCAELVSEGQKERARKNNL